jgi:uncharacterized protein (TIGR02145 family)
MKKQILLLLLFYVAFQINLKAQTGTFIDSRDNQEYKWVQIGEQIWIAENLNYDAGEGSMCYDSLENNCSTYGKLYSWEVATNSCPTGWHLPSNDEWQTLTIYVGGENVAGGKLKERGTSHWNSPNAEATDEFEFTALPGGIKLEGNLIPYQFLNIKASFWSSTEDGDSKAWARTISYDSESVLRMNYDKSVLRYSVRCIKDESPEPEKEYWMGFYNKLENNPERKEIKTLYEFYPGSYKEPIKICADGSKATIVKFQKDASLTNKRINFLMKGSGDYSQDYIGGFLSEDYTYSGDIVSCKFTHPTYMNLKMSSYRPDVLAVLADGKIIFEYPIRIYRAPVVMVHGLWGDISNFAEMKEFFCKNLRHYDGILIYLANYELTNGSSFHENSNVIKKAINNEFTLLIDQGYSAGKVNIVAHSMGGVLSRLYIQNELCSETTDKNCYREDVHKFITLNTPHSGSQGANLILDPIGIVLRSALSGSGRKCGQGAVDDLMVSSKAIENLNGEYLNKNFVSSHVITTDVAWANEDNDCSKLAVLLKTQANIMNLSVSELLEIIFNKEENDLIVSISSQKGGLNLHTNFKGQCHLDAAKNYLLELKVDSLLDFNSNNNLNFSMQGFTPPTLTSVFKKPGSLKSSSLKSTGTLTITNPLDNTNFYTSDSIFVSVQGSSNITNILFVAGNKNLDLYAEDIALSSTTFKYIVPNEAIGKINLLTIGYGDEGFIAMDSISINISTNATLEKITSYQDKLFIPKGKAVGVSLNGHYDDGGIRNVESISEIQYSFGNDLIAKHANNNLVKGENVGETLLLVSYQGKILEIPIEVYESDDWTDTTTTEKPDTLEPIDSLNIANLEENIFDNLNIYPNPSKGNLLVDFRMQGKQKVEIKISNLFGQQIFCEFIKPGENHQHKISLENYAYGIYYLQLVSDNQTISKKIIISK